MLLWCSSVSLCVSQLSVSLWKSHLLCSYRHLPGINPNWLSWILVHCLILLSTTLSHILKVCDRSLIYIYIRYFLCALLDVTFSLEDWYISFVAKPTAFVLYAWCFWKMYIESLFQSWQYMSTPQLVFPLLLYCLPTVHPFEGCLCFFPCHCLVVVSFFSFNSLGFLIHQHVKVLAPSLLAFIILHQNFSCCTFSCWSYSPSVASAFTLATTLFASPFAVLSSTLSFSSPVLFQIFSLSFFSLTALFVSSFHHQLSSPVFFLQYTLLYIH